jgi:hypothetical protein
VRGSAADYGDHQRGVRKTLALEFDVFGFGVRIFGAERGGNGFASGKPRLAFEHDESPGRELAMVWHAARNGQKRVDFGSGRAGGRQRDGFVGNSRGKEFDGIGHGRSS